MTAFPLSSEELQIQLINNEDGTIGITAEMGEITILYETGIEQAALTGVFSVLYESEADEWPDRKELGRIGQAFFEPIHSLVDQSDQITFYLPENSLYYLPDLLICNEDYLYLQKPVVYAFSKKRRKLPVYKDKWELLLISDYSADPERWIREVSQKFNRFLYIDETRAEDLDEILQSDRSFDMILSTSHGELVDHMNQGFILGDEEYGPLVFQGIGAELVFLDACEIGASTGFVQTFRDNGTAVFIASPIATEAGGSSNRLLSLFCHFLKKGDSPVDALYKTKLNLSDHYRYGGEELRLWRSFPYRIYHY